MEYHINILSKLAQARSRKKQLPQTQVSCTGCTGCSGCAYILVLDIVSKVLISRIIEVSIYIVSEAFCPPSPGINVFFMQIRNESFDVSNIEILPGIDFVFCLAVRIVSNSIPTSISNTNNTHVICFRVKRPPSSS